MDYVYLIRACTKKNIYILYIHIYAYIWMYVYEDKNSLLIDYIILTLQIKITSNFCTSFWVSCFFLFFTFILFFSCFFLLLCGYALVNKPMQPYTYSEESMTEISLNYLSFYFFISTFPSFFWRFFFAKAKADLVQMVFLTYSRFTIQSADWFFVYTLLHYDRIFILSL